MFGIPAREHEGAAFGLAVTAYGGQILHGIGIQKFNDFIHDEYLQNDGLFFAEGVFPFDALIVTAIFRLEKYALFYYPVTQRKPYPLRRLA